MEKRLRMETTVSFRVEGLGSKPDISELLFG